MKREWRRTSGSFVGRLWDRNLREWKESACRIYHILERMWLNGNTNQYQNALVWRRS